ncbi:MAG: site-specific integrase [Gaiellales bacterium]|nr:site-specific integrase [Gaiellales bacterium]
MAGRRAQGEGSIYFREERGRWYGELDLGWREGRRVRKAVSGRTQREVQVKLADLRRRYAQGLRIDRDQQTVEQFLIRWLTWKDAHVRPRSAASYRTYVEGHAIPALGKTRLMALSVDEVQAMLDRRRDVMKPRSVQHLRDILRAALNDAIRWGEVERNVATHARVPEGKNEPRVAAFTKDDAAALLSTMAGHRMERLFRLALALGLRRSEICGLRWEAVDLDRKSLSVVRTYQRAPKQGLHLEEPKSPTSRREIAPLSQFALEALRAQRRLQAGERLPAANRWQDGGYVFTNEFGRPYDPDRVTHEFKAVARAAGLPDLSFHKLRHAAATMMLAEGVSLKVVQEVLGHASYHVTANIYGHVVPELRQAAADAVDRSLADHLADQSEG